MARIAARQPSKCESVYSNLRIQFTAKHGQPLIDTLLDAVERAAPRDTIPLRHAIVHVDESTLTAEATYVQASLFDEHRETPLAALQYGETRQAFMVAHVVPTSVGAAVGGFAGDASPATRLLAATADSVLTHPNVVNASDILYKTENTLYIEGWGLDRFFLKDMVLRPVVANRVGVVIERQPARFVDLVRHSVDAAHATCGIPVVGYAVTDEKVGTRVRRFESGAYAGVIDNPRTLITAARKLVDAGATAIAITTEILDLPDIRPYVHGLEPNPHGGVEAVLSHTVSRYFGIPSAHAPMWGENSQAEDEHFPDADPREGAELVSLTAIGCVLQGLHRAPRLVSSADRRSSDIAVSGLSALVTPAGSLGTIPALACAKYGVPVIGVRENKTIQNVDAGSLGITHYYEAANYLEAIGILCALRCGVSMQSVRRPLAPAPKI